MADIKMELDVGVPDPLQRAESENVTADDQNTQGGHLEMHDDDPSTMRNTGMSGASAHVQTTSLHPSSHTQAAPGSSQPRKVVMMDPLPQPSNLQAPAAAAAFNVDKTRLTSIAMVDQATELQQLGLTVYNQEEFEQGVMEQVDEALAKEEQARAQRLMQKELKQVMEELRLTKQSLKDLDKVLSLMSPQSTRSKEETRRLVSVRSQKETKLKQLKKLKSRQRTLQRRLVGEDEDQDQDVDSEDADDPASASLLMDKALGLKPVAKETERERMIRLGEMTPFGSTITEPKPRTTSQGMTDFEKYLKDQEAKMSKAKKAHKTKMIKSATASDLPSKGKVPSPSKLKRTHSESSLWNGSLHEPGNRFDEADKHHYRSGESDTSRWRIRQRCSYPRLKHNFSEDGVLSEHEEEEEAFGDEDYVPHPDEMIGEDEDFSAAADVAPRKKRGKFGPTPRRKIKEWGVDSEDEGEDDIGAIKSQYKTDYRRSQGPLSRSRDDGNRKAYEARMKKWKKEELKKKQERIMAGETGSEEENEEEFDGGLRVPQRIWKKLYRYQKTGVRWMWELHQQQAGGIIGDEMGLGKTIQMIAFMAALSTSRLLDKATHSRYVGLGPCLIVCPATVMHQWVREFHIWWPQFRVAILHSSGSYNKSESHLVESVRADNGVLITSYSSLVIHQDLLHSYDWHYVVLDEGHKIRNPDAQVTIACKTFITCHRLILSGSPIQNNLKELWSLFDFVFPGKLGTLPDFMSHFSVPITQGGYSNASQVQVQTSYKCACVLRDTINPYLLRRMKADVQVNLDLPEKNEQVLFCRLTDEQRDVYKEYLESKECQMILAGNFMVFPGLITLRKVCNHPDISTGGLQQFRSEATLSEEERQYGYYKRSGKMIVVESLLKLWHQQGHRVLLFSQSTQMLTILEKFVLSRGYRYLRMDGTTTIASRQPLISRFNEDSSLFVFLLTTRVGGLGVNLTGANRIIIYDPDWNPSTDMQARERAWRIGQTRQVTIYRLLTTGTIEEKIYHRQIFKQFLTNRVLKDPKQRRFFKSNDLFELFTLGSDDPNSTETSAIFAGTGSDVALKPKPSGGRSNRFDQIRKRKEEEKAQKEMEAAAKEKMAASEVTVDVVVSEAVDVDKETETSKETASLEVGTGTDPSPEDEEEDEASLLGLSAERLQQMREMARKLSQQIGSSAPAKPSATEASEETSQDPLQPGTSGGRGDCSGGNAKKKKHKKKKRRVKDAECEGESISYLDKLSDYVPGASQHADHAPDKPTDDDYVLKSLMKKSGVHSAMQHDRIMMSADPDYALVECEAERVAQQAAKALKESRARCGAQPGVPTWTGASGLAGGPRVARPRFGQKKNARLLNGSVSSRAETSLLEPDKPSGATDLAGKMFDGAVAGNVSTACGTKATPITMTSVQLLEKMRTRNWASCGDGERQASSDKPAGRPSEENLELLTDIRNHVAFGCGTDGQASTEEILSHFRSHVPAKLAPKFKAMLRQICTLDKSSGLGLWRLKPEFR